MMILERVSDHVHALRLKTGKKTLRITNRCDGMHTLTGEVCNGFFVTVDQRTHQAAAKQHEHLARLRIASVADAKINSIQAIQRFAQGPRGQQLCVTKATFAIDNANFDITREPVMLQAVVCDQYIAPLVDQQLCSDWSVAPDGHRHTGRANQSRFVTDFGRVRRIAQQKGFALRSTVTSTHNTWPITACTKRFNQGQCKGRLARAACRDISNHDHRTGQSHRTEHT